MAQRSMGGLGATLVAIARRFRTFGIVYREGDYVRGLSRELNERVSKMQQDIEGIDDVIAAHEELARTLEGSTSPFGPGLREKALQCARIAKKLRDAVKRLAEVAAMLDELMAGGEDDKQYSIYVLLALYNPRYKVILRDLPRYLDAAKLPDYADTVREINRNRTR